MLRNSTRIILILFVCNCGCKYECHPRVFLENHSNRIVRVELPRTGPSEGLGPVKPGQVKEVFTSWVMDTELRAQILDAKSGETLAEYNVDKETLGSGFTCERVTLRYPLKGN